jgi:DNA-binding transcriptional ArsR family regulator
MDCLGDPAVRMILSATHHRARSALEMFQETGVPITTLYRKIHELEELQLVGVERSAITPEGKRVEFYRSRLEEAQIHLSGGVFQLRARYRDLAAARLESMWTTVREEVRR